jgi:NAD+-dependent protein deacetylase SIR2
MRLYTQNVDGIDTSIPPLATRVPLNTKAPWPLTIQLHGGLDKMVCTKCGDLRDFDGAQFDGAEAPLCLPCLEHDNVRTMHGGKRSHGVGRLRPRMVLYNEYNPDEEAIGNVTKADLRRVPDAVIVVGTTLKIPGLRRIVKEMCQVTRSRRDGITAWINIDPEPQGPEFKDCWDIVVRGRSDDIAELTALVPWNEQGSEALENSELPKDVADKVKTETGNVAPGFIMENVETLLFDDRRASAASEAASGVVVEIPSGGLYDLQRGGIPTPIASPKPRSPIPHKSLQHGKTKQSKLSFVKAPLAGGSALEATKPAKAKKSRQPKSKPGSSLPPKGSINKTFKATKRSARSGPVESKEPLFESDLNSLPALRPSSPQAKEKPYRESSSEFSSASDSSPTTPRVRQGLLDAVIISPRSKPNKMDHLID